MLLSPCLPRTRRQFMLRLLPDPDTLNPWEMGQTPRCYFRLLNKHHTHRPVTSILICICHHRNSNRCSQIPWYKISRCPLLFSPFFEDQRCPPDTTHLTHRMTTPHHRYRASHTFTRRKYSRFPSPSSHKYLFLYHESATCNATTAGLLMVVGRRRSVNPSCCMREASEIDLNQPTNTPCRI